MILLFLSCGGEMYPAAAPEQSEKNGRYDENEEDARGGEGGGMGRGAPAAPAAAKARAPGAAQQEVANDVLLTLGGAKEEKDNAAERKPADSRDGEAPALRSWFPESFLWMPLVQTGAEGTLTVPVQVPDSLTTWRVLALGLTGSGAQGGATTTFLSTLPAYVDMNLPSYLYAGDRFALPVQVVSQQAEPLKGMLSLSVQGGTGAGAGMVSVPAYGSLAKVVQISAPNVGRLAVTATLEGVDAVERSVPVRPVGRPVDQSRGGTLGAPRELRVEAPNVTGRLDLQVYPGTLSLVASELVVAPGRGGGIWTDAYAWLLATQATPLVQSGELKEEDRRAVALRALQRLRRQSLRMDPPVAVPTLIALAEAAPESLEGVLAGRMRAALAEAQAPDGLWPGSSAGIDDILVATAQAAWALGPENRSNRLRAQGAFERYAARVESPYVAVWGLVAEVVEPGSAEALRKKVKDAIAEATDGTRYLSVEGSRGDGSRATTAEATALALIVFKDDPELSSDLAGWLLANYTPGSGFGDGLSSLLSLRALQIALKGELPPSVAVILSMDGKEVGRGLLDPAQPHQPLHLGVEDYRGAHDLRISTEPPVPGLAWNLVQRSYLPWEQALPRGLDLQVTPSVLAVGTPGTMAVRVAGPVDARVTVELGLPPSVTADPTSLEALKNSGLCSATHVQDGQVRLEGVVLNGGAASLELGLSATVSGQLWAGASRVYVDGNPQADFVRVPKQWSIR